MLASLAQQLTNSIPGATYSINGVKVTYGQMIAMGDYFGSPDEMKKAPAKVIKRLVELIERDKADPGKAVSTEEWQDATKDPGAGHTYLDVSARNAPHFAPGSTPSPSGSPPTDQNAAWKTYHFQALDLARDGKQSEAMETNAFADHFLTDAFAAGHLINKADVMAKSKKSYEALPKRGKAFMKTSDFTDRVATAVMKDTRAAKLNDYEINVGRVFDDWQPVSAATLSEILAGVSGSKEEQFYSLFVRILHDRLNADIKHRGGGVEVENNLGHKWRLSGDETLKYSEDSLEIGRRAVAQSQANVTSVIGAKAPPDKEGLAKKVWDFTPHPTAAGKKKIDEFESELTDAGKEETAREFADVILENLDTLINQLWHEEHRLKPKEKVKK